MKKRISEKIFLELNNGIFLELRAEQTAFILGIKLNIWLGDLLVIILCKQGIFCNTVDFNFSKSNLLKFCSLDVPQMVLVIANAALYWRFYSFWWKEEL